MTKRYGSCVRGVETAENRLAARPSAMNVVVTHKKKVYERVWVWTQVFLSFAKNGQANVKVA